MSGITTAVTNGAVTANTAVYGGWWNGGNAAVTGGRFLVTSGTMTGTIRIYGVN